MPYFAILWTRSFMILCTSWTALVQSRHPLELGGATWSGIITWNVVLGVVLTFTHDDESMRVIATACCVDTVVSYAMFFTSCHPTTGGPSTVG